MCYYRMLACNRQFEFQANKSWQPANDVFVHQLVLYLSRNANATFVSDSVTRTASKFKCDIKSISAAFSKEKLLNVQCNEGLIISGLFRLNKLKVIND